MKETVTCIKMIVMCTDRLSISVLVPATTVRVTVCPVTVVHTDTVCLDSHRVMCTPLLDSLQTVVITILYSIQTVCTYTLSTQLVGHRRGEKRETGILTHCL